MGDIKLFRITPSGVVELPGQSVALEKSMQARMEKNLDALLGVRFLASEYATSKSHSGRIDTLGIDENNLPVIIEYKRATNENVINQGLFYLDWLLEHRADFQLLVQKILGYEAADAIDWSGPRLLCIAGDFTKYDSYAVQQINRNIELIRYRFYGGELLLFELVNASIGQVIEDGETNGKPAKQGGKAYGYKGTQAMLDKAAPELHDLYANLETWLISLGDDVQLKKGKYYFAFRRFRNFVSVMVHPQTGTLLMYINIDPESVPTEDGFTRDIINPGNWTTS